ncbi:hypothetical protein H8D30_06345 [bacterium]|nr:hypothetical protein [bacterium]
MNELRISIQREARRLLKRDYVSVVIGYQVGPYPGTTAPCFAFRPDDVQSLVFNCFSTLNLATYLPGIQGKVGIVATPAVVRSIKELVKDGLVKRENLHIIGVRFTGYLDPNRVLVSRSNENQITFPDCPEALWEWSWHDLFEKPEECDLLVEPRWMFDLENKEKPDLGRTNLERLSHMTHPQRRAHWLEMFGSASPVNETISHFPSTYGGGDHLTETGLVRGDYSPEDLFFQHLCWVYQGLGRLSGFDLSDLGTERGKVPVSAIRAWSSRHFRRIFDYRPGDRGDNPLTLSRKIEQ